MSKKIRFNTIGLSTVAETIRAALVKNATPVAIEQSIEEAFPHPNRSWAFYGLDDGINYTVKFQKYVGSTWIDIPGFLFTFTTDNPEVTYKAPLQIQPDNTIGFVSGVNSVVFDGSAGKDDWRGFDIQPERIGTGTMVRGLHYTWDPTTGTWTLLAVGDLFQSLEYFIVNFSLLTSQTGGGQVASGKQWGQATVKNANYQILDSDFGNKIIAKGAGDYFELTMPDIATIPEGKLIYIESGIGNHFCMGIKAFNNAQKFDWLEGNRSILYMGRCEGISIYREVIDSTHSQWRVHTSEGNFKTVGNDFHSYADPSDLVNALLLDGGGTGVSVLKYARLYNDHVLKQDPSKVCSFADWSTGNNKYKFSFANGSGFFHIPDTRDMFLRNTSAGRDVGIFVDHAMMDHAHSIARGDSYNGSSQQSAKKAGGGQGSNLQTDMISKGIIGLDGTPLTTHIATETRPVSLSTNHFITV